MYAQHGHELMGWKSPVGEPIHDSEYTKVDLTTSRRQGQTREGMSEGSPSAKLRAYEQKRHRRPSLWGEWAQDHKTPGSGDKVNGEVVQRQFMFLSGEICLACGALCTALVSAMILVIRQKSADGTVVGGHRM